ncbi:ATP-binding protein [Microcoleus sp.]|uniref:ATP-binding protein n=1 Tax=Microcoleus sp. TaxID=44472 RepID=UPI00403EAFC8
MPLIDLANTKIRIIGCSAVMAIGQVISNAIANPATQAAAGMMGSPIALGEVSILATIASGIAGNMAANDLGNRITQRLSKNPKILDNHDLIKAAGEAIAYILREVAKSDELIAIAETKKLPYPETPLSQLAENTPECWLDINTNTADLSRGLNIPEDQLNLIFCADAEEFDQLTGLTTADWASFVKEFAASKGESFDAEIVEFVAHKLYATFPKVYRKVLKQDAAKGGEKFAAMLLNLYQIALAELRDLGLRNGEILQKLEAVATGQQICQVMVKLSAIEIGIRYDLGQIKTLLERFVDTSAPRLPLPYDCETIIQDRTQDFTGRQFVFAAIANFLQNNRKGYFILEAEPGVGKSSILAKLVLLLNRRCVAHFNSQSQGLVRAEQFLENACLQLIDSYQLNYPQLPENATRDGNFLSRLLGEVSPKLGGKKLILVVDALDEVEISLQGRGSNVLYLPDALPDNVYFIVSKQPKTLPLPNHQVFDLMQYSAESWADVNLYIDKRTSNSASIQNWINSQNLQRDQFVAAVAQKSQHNFMYLRYVLNDIDSGKYSDVTLEDLPRELEGYYEKHWARMEMAVRDRELRRRKLKVIYLLTKTRKPVSCDLLAHFAEEDALDVQKVLDDWGQFLGRNSDNPPDYSINHASFQRFLHRKDVVQKAGVSLRDIETAISDNLWEDLYGDE